MKDNTKSISTTMVDLGMPILLKLIWKMVFMVIMFSTKYNCCMMSTEIFMLFLPGMAASEN